MITDLEARKIASDWHGGGETALYALSSTGAIDTARNDHDVLDEIDTAMWATASQEDVDNLHHLSAYAKHHGTRGPVDGWSKLSW